MNDDDLSHGEIRRATRTVPDCPTPIIGTGPLARRRARKQGRLVVPRDGHFEWRCSDCGARWYKTPPGINSGGGPARAGWLLDDRYNKPPADRCTREEPA